MQILISLIRPFKLLLLYEITTSCLILDNNNHESKEIIEIHIMGLKQLNNIYIQIYSQTIFTSKSVRFDI